MLALAVKEQFGDFDPVAGNVASADDWARLDLHDADRKRREHSLNCGYRQRSKQLNGQGDDEAGPEAEAGIERAEQQSSLHRGQRYASVQELARQGVLGSFT